MQHEPTGGDDLRQFGLGDGSVGVAVGGDDALVDARGGFDFEVAFVGEHRVQPRSLPAGEQVGTGAQQAADPVERVAAAAAVAVDVLLDALSAAVQRVTT